MQFTPRLIAYYLPQYHPIQENDIWWGKGFTEWTNVTKAKPFFKDHYQPHYPADLGYYDLRLPEVREAQAAMAKANGIEGFMYYHYWFGNGKRLLELPFNEVLKTHKPDFPFCLCWANESWKGSSFGEFTSKLLIEQTYPGREDYVNHFYSLLPAFKDERYIKVSGKPLFNVYMPLNLPDKSMFTQIFNQLAVKEGFPGMFLVGSRCPLEWNPLQNGFNGVIGSEVASIRYKAHSMFKKKKRYSVKKAQQFVERILNKPVFTEKKMPAVVAYEQIIDQLISNATFNFDYYPCVVPNWDNTPRSQDKGFVFHNSTPALFGKHLQKAFHKVQHLPPAQQFIFIKSWNEWAEGNYLEPDTKFGYSYLEEIKRQLALLKL